MNKIIIFFLFGLLSSVAFGNDKKIIPDGNYEFTWNIAYSSEEKEEFLAN